MSTNLQLYTGYYSGGLPVVADPQPFDVAQDLSTGNLWQYTGNGWVAPSWSTNLTLYLSAANTVCDRINGAETIIPSYLKAYPGDSDMVPAELSLSSNDLAIYHNVGNYNIKVNVFRTDVVSDTIVEVPFPEGSVISTEDGLWTILKNFNTFVGFDFCSITLTFLSLGNGSAPQMLEYLTKSEAQQYIQDTIESAGYVTADEVTSMGYVTADEVTSMGYVTDHELDSRGYVTLAEVASMGYVTETSLDSRGYITAEDVTSMGFVTESELNSRGYATENYVSSYVAQHTPAVPVQSVNSQVGAVVLDASDVGAVAMPSSGDLTLPIAVITPGQATLALTTVTDIAPSDGIIYTHTLAANDAISFATPTAGYVPTFELWLTQPATAVSFSFSNTITWADDQGNFAAGNEAPDMSTANTQYVLVLRYDGSKWLGNLAYSEALA